MEVSRSVLGVIGGLCLALGAGGAYLATRADESEPAGTFAAAGPEIAPPFAVEQSETVIAPEPVAEPTSQAAAAPKPSPASTRSVTTRRAVPSQAPSRVAPGRDTSAEPQTAGPALAVPPSLQPYRDEPVAEVAEIVEPPAPEVVELVIASDAVIGLQVETSLTSERARVEDPVLARVTRDVRVGDRVAIPAGARAEGEVTVVERGGRLRERARLGVRFTSIVLADGTRLPIETETVYREGDSPGGESRAKIGGGAIAGAIIGGILGGAKGAVLGGSAGAGAGTAAVLAGGRNAATLTPGTPLTVRLVEPASVTVQN